MIGKLLLIIMLCYGIALSQSGEVIYVPGSTVKICQLVGDYDRERQTPTQNLTDTRYHLWGTDLGVPFSHYGHIFLLFGDTIGPPGGDAIAYTTDWNPEDGLELTFIHDPSGTYKPVQIPGIDQADFHVPMEGVSGAENTVHTNSKTWQSGTIPPLPSISPCQPGIPTRWY